MLKKNLRNLAIYILCNWIDIIDPYNPAFAQCPQLLNQNYAVFGKTAFPSLHEILQFVARWIIFGMVRILETLCVRRNRKHLAHLIFIRKQQRRMRVRHFRLKGSSKVNPKDLPALQFRPVSKDRMLSAVIPCLGGFSDLLLFIIRHR